MCRCIIAVMASQNTRALSQVPPERQAKRQAATQKLMKRAMERSAEGNSRDQFARGHIAPLLEAMEIAQ